MRKVIITSVLFFVLILCACTNSTGQANSSSSSAQSLDFPTFGASAELWADAIGESLEDGGVYNTFSNEPTISEDESEIFGDIRCLSYPVGENANVMLYENQDMQQCYQFSMTIDWGSIDPASDETLLIGYYTGLLILAAEQDAVSAEEIGTELGLLDTYNAYDDTARTAESEHASYTYTTQNAVTIFNVIAK